MKKNKSKHCLLRAMACSFCVLWLWGGFSGCVADKWDGSGGQGLFQLNLEADTAGLDGRAMSRASSFDWSPYLDTDQYQIEILEGDENRVVRVYDRYIDMPEVVELERGDYKVRASRGLQKPAAFEAPRFEGVADFKIKEAMTTRLHVACELVNARVTVAYTDSFKLVYPTYAVAFSSSHTTEPLVYVQDESRSGWFQVHADGENLTGVITATPDTGAVKTLSVSIPAVKPKDDVRITFNASPELRPDRGTTVKVTINEEVIDVPVNVYVPDYMLPVKAVALESIGFAHEDPISLATTDNAQAARVHIYAPGTIRNCWLTKRKDGQTLGQYDLATAEGALQAERANLGLELPEIWKKKEVAIDFTAMVNRLPRNAAGDLSVHTYDFIVQVRDSLLHPHTSDSLMLRVRMIPDIAPQIALSGFTSGLVETIIEGGVSTDGTNRPRTYQATVKSESAIGSCSLEVVDVNGRKQTYTGSTLSELATKAGIGLRGETFDFSDVAARLEAPSDTPSRASYTLSVTSQSNGNTYTATSRLNLAVAPPAFEMTMNGDTQWNGDAFAKRALLRAKVLRGKGAAITGFEYREGSGSWMPVPGTAVLDADEEKTLVLTGLTPRKNYEARAVYGKHTSEAVSFTTEDTMQLPNVSAKGIDRWFSEPYGVGGRTIWYPWDHNDESTKGWDTSNNESMQSGNANVYESAAGVMASNGQTLIRTVGWADKGNAVTNWAGILKKQEIGKLFFNSARSGWHGAVVRPYALSFDCVYALKASRSSRFRVSVILLDAQEEVLTQKVFEAGPETTRCHLVIPYPKNAAKAGRLELVIQSDVASTLLGSDAKGSGTFNRNPPTTEIIGSQLTLSNLQLNYE